MKKILTVLMVLLTIVAFSSGAMAQAPAKPAAPAATDKPKVENKESSQATEVSGTVAAYEAGKAIKVKGKDKETTFEITGDTKINGEVKVGAKATVMYKMAGEKMIATVITVATEKKS